MNRISRSQPLAHLLDVAWLAIDGDGSGVEVLRATALEDCANIDCVLAVRQNGLPELCAHTDSQRRDMHKSYMTEY